VPGSTIKDGQIVGHVGDKAFFVNPPVSAEMQLIRDLATDNRVGVEKLAALMQLHERAEARDAHKQFTSAFRAASMEMPRVEKRGVIDMGAKGRMAFARYEDVDRIVREVEIRHGFTRSFLSEPSGTGILITCVLSHAAGHSERSTRQMPPDPGPGRNSMQAIGSASSYAKRYLTLDVWNIVTANADDDANSADPIDSQQWIVIKDMLDRLAMEPARVAEFWAWAEAKTPETIQRRNYARIHAELSKRLKECGR
jgi:ERF superfamily